MKYLIIFLSLLLVPTSCQGQKTVEQHLGGWSGELPVTDAFVFNILLNLRLLLRPETTSRT